MELDLLIDVAGWVHFSFTSSALSLEAARTDKTEEAGDTDDPEEDSPEDMAHLVSFVSHFFHFLLGESLSLVGSLSIVWLISSSVLFVFPRRSVVAFS